MLDMLLFADVVWGVDLMYIRSRELSSDVRRLEHHLRLNRGEAHRA